MTGLPSGLEQVYAGEAPRLSIYAVNVTPAVHDYHVTLSASALETSDSARFKAGKHIDTHQKCRVKRKFTKGSLL
jgi:hypothetical protein